MKRADSFLCHVDIENGRPVGDGAIVIEKAIAAYKQVEKMTKAKFRIRLTARGKRGIKLSECNKATAYIYMKRVK